MKIGFVNFTPLIYDVETPLREPLGGSESAMCYLAVALARLGNEVILFRRVDEEITLSGVFHLPLNKIISESLDILVIQNTPSSGPQIKKMISSKTKIVFWSQHASNQPAVAGMRDKEILNSFDKIVLISEWQKRDYQDSFGLKSKRISLIRNAISPAFENLSGKKAPLSMAYTSTPFRGLDLLPGIFSRIKSVRSEAELTVFSSMKVYQVDEEKVRDYEKLYESCRETYGMTYVGSLPQIELAKRMVNVEILAYPNIFPETSCIAVMEAMAAGCQIVTTNLGSLPETTAGFGRLVDITGEVELFYEKFINALQEPIDKKKITKQIKYVNKYYTWDVRAKEWQSLFYNLCIL